MSSRPMTDAERSDCGCDKCQADITSGGWSMDDGFEYWCDDCHDFYQPHLDALAALAALREKIEAATDPARVKALTTALDALTALLD